MDRHPREQLSEQESERARALVSQLGLREAARVLGIDWRTLSKAALGSSVHRLTAITIRTRLSDRI